MARRKIGDKKPTPKEVDIPKVQADDHSIAFDGLHVGGTVTGNITIGHTIVQLADARLRHDLGILLRNVQKTWVHFHDYAVKRIFLQEVGGGYRFIHGCCLRISQRWGRRKV